MNNTPTRRTDDGGRYCTHQRRERWIKTGSLKTSEELESELATVTEQLDQYKAALQSADNHNHEIATKLEIVTEQRDRLADLVKQFIYILDITEESDGGRLFHPTNITSCRVGDLQKAGQLVEALRRAVKGGSDDR